MPQDDARRHAMLKIWGRSNAYNVQKVLWLIAELKLDCEHVDIGSSVGDLDSEAFLAINPHARVPVIMDNGNYIWEANTILRYLAAVNRPDIYQAQNPMDQTFIERWMDWELASLQPDFLSLFWKFYRTPEDIRDSDAIATALTRCERNLTILDAHLEGSDYVAGPEFSLADICVGTSFYRLFNMGIELPEWVNVSDWYHRLTARPAYRKNIMTPFDELKGRLEY